MTIVQYPFDSMNCAFGDDKRICDARVYADPAADVAYQCQATVEAVNKATPGTF